VGFDPEEIWKIWVGLMKGIIPGTTQYVERSILVFKDAEELL
jgi:hypothetical protein